MNSLWDIRIFWGLVPKESLCICKLHVDRVDPVNVQYVDDAHDSNFFLTSDHKNIKNEHWRLITYIQQFYPLVLTNFNVNVFQLPTDQYNGVSNQQDAIISVYWSF
jgi:hypothetical protein